MKITKLLLQLFLVSIVLTSCSSDDKIVEVIRDKYDDGIIISSEGNFGNKDGSVAYVDNSLSTVATNFIYTGKNNAQLGGLIQSITFTDTDAYIILNDVNTIVVVDRITFEKKTEINTGLGNPRYMTIVNGKGYVTNWGDGANENDDYLAIIDIETNTIEENTISLANGVEQIVSRNNKLYISHKGGWSSNNIVSVVDLNNNNAVSTVTVKDNPDEIVFDNSGNLIVLSEGKPLTYNDDYTEVLTSTTSSISFINTSTNEVTKEMVFPENKRATYLTQSEGKLYYYQGDTDKVYSISETATELADDGISVGSIYGMNVKGNELFTVKYEFTKLSKLLVYDINTKSEVYSSPVGLGASKIYFN
ncbi:YncE family protein [Tenacibaculum sp. Ill]|uniref:YncE family protein n=1 Tax=Tenacibaculum sp. Ill TaxID=3445935 RepID=UPI003F7B2683